MLSYRGVMILQKVLFTAQVREYVEYLDAGMIDHIGRQMTESFEGFEDCDLMAFDWYDLSGEDYEASQILVYIDREDLFLICEDERSYERCSALLPEGQNNERALYLFFAGLLKGDTARLDGFEVSVTNAEDAALRSSREDYLGGIHEYRKKLLRMKRYYEQLDAILDELVANDNDLLTPDGVRHFSIIHGRVEHFRSEVLNLREYVTQMREACQAQIDLEQNNLMRIFTVIAAVFLPLTLIVGWYGMNFAGMPELSWKYGYPAVIVLSAAVCAALIFWFKRKKWF